MIVRESGMPPEAVWDTFFDAKTILQRLGLSSKCGDLLEFGCGYGTFTLPAARIVSGTVHTLELDREMLAAAGKKAAAAGLTNIVFHERDFVAHGTGLSSRSIDFALMFNILHLEEPVPLLCETYRNLADGGLLAIVHWIHSADTPRGPPLDIRPRPEQCQAWAEEAGFMAMETGIMLPPYHYGLVLQRQGPKAAERADVA